LKVQGPAVATLLPYTTLFRSGLVQMEDEETGELLLVNTASKKVRLNYSKFYQEKVDYYKESFNKSGAGTIDCRVDESYVKKMLGDRKSTRLNSSHVKISYAVF